MDLNFVWELRITFDWKLVKMIDFVIPYCFAKSVWCWKFSIYQCRHGSQICLKKCLGFLRNELLVFAENGLKNGWPGSLLFRKHYPAGIYLLNVNNRNNSKVWNMFKVNNKDTRTKLWCLCWWLWTYFASCFSVFIVNFEYAIADCLNVEINSWST